MGLGHSPRIVTENLVLLLDAGNPRNFNLTAVEVLVVAGGGSGGYGESNINGGGGGGGGAGGLIYNSNFAVTPGTQLAANVGAGGAGLANSASAGNNGANSVFGSLIAIGGGAGGGGDFEGSNAGGSGGSGGGAGGDGTYGPSIFSAGTSGQGFAGGARNGTTNRAAAGGGGAGGAGSSATPGANSTGTGGTGGTGLGFNISGTFIYYAGGGGGGASNNFSSGVVNSIGGIGGGGAGGGSSGSSNGTANTGGGGGGGYGSDAGAGGSGIIIVRYPGPQKAIGGVVTSVGGDTIHTFTTSGNFTPLVATNGSAVLGLSDLSGNRNFGTSAGGPTYSSANGGSLSFEGSDEYVTKGGVIVPNSSSPYTVSVWCYRNRNNVGSEELLSQWTSANSNNSFFFGFDNLNVRFTDNWNPVTVPGAGNTGVWMNLVGVYSVSNAFIYLNGSLSATRGSGFSYGGTGNFIIGRQGELSSEYFSGRISNTQIYNRALTAAEVSQNFNALRGRYGL